MMKAGTEVEEIHVKRPEYRGSEMERRITRWERNGKKVLAEEKNNKKFYLFLLWGFGLGPGSDVTRSSPSIGEKLSLRVGALDVRLGLVPHFALGPITNVSSPTSSGRDFLIVGVNDVDGWLEIRGSEFLNAGVTVPSNRTPSKATAHTAKRCQTGQQLHMEYLVVGRVTHEGESSGTASVPSPGCVRLAPRPRSWLSRSSGPREVEDGRMLPAPPRPNYKKENNAEKE